MSKAHCQFFNDGWYNSFNKLLIKEFSDGQSDSLFASGCRDLSVS